MAYWSNHCSATLRCSVCISVFCTLLVLSVLFPFMLSAPCPFNAPFPFCTFLLLCSASFFTPQSHLNNNNLDLFFVLHSYSLCAPCACNMHQAPACSPPPTVLHIGVFTRTSLCHISPSPTSTFYPFCFSSSCRVLYLIIIATLQLLWRFHPRVQHHWVLY
jgi:hypothetical protein